MSFQRNLKSKCLMLITIMLYSDGVRSEDFLTQFQPEIVQIPTELDTLILHIEQNINPESETACSIQPIRLCVPSSEEYLEFWSLTNNFGEDVDSPSITIVQSTECTESDELDKLKVWILQIKNDFYEVLKKTAWSNAYVELKISYEHKLSRFSKRIDESAKKVLSDEGKNAVSKLKIEYKSMEEKIRSFFNKLQNKKRLENDKLADRCVAELIANRIDSALKIFIDIDEERIARQVIIKSFQSSDSFQTLFDFIQLLGDSSATLYAYQGLIIKGRFNYINSLIFLSGIEKHKGSEFKTISNSLQVKLKPFFQTGDYSDFYSAVNNRIAGTVDFGQNIMPTFVHGAYNSDVRNVENMLDMQSKFYYMRHKLFLIDSLITEMKIQDHTNKPEFLMVLSDLIDLKAKVYKESNENDKKIVIHVYENVPYNLLPLMNSNLCIQNSETSEFMHADNVANNGHRQIFTSNANQFDETFNFEAEFLDRGRTLLFKNAPFGEYLYSVDGEIPRKLLLMKGDLKNDKRARFMIEAVDSTNVRIKNEMFNEFLYSSESNDEDGHIVQSKGEVLEEGLWKLITCSDAKH